jgi:Ca2+-binding EF-hand superfamily protein
MAEERLTGDKYKMKNIRKAYEYAQKNAGGDRLTKSDLEDAYKALGIDVDKKSKGGMADYIKDLIK